jgi:hypothetical protein
VKYFGLISMTAKFATKQLKSLENTPVIMHQVKLYALVASLYQTTALLDRSLIFNGKGVLDDRFTFMVTLKDEDGNHKCGGTLIAHDAVLTAAHCLKIVAQVGTGSNETHLIRQAVKHPNYTGRDPSSSGGVSVDPYNIGLIFFDSGERANTPVQLNSEPLIPQNSADLVAVGWNTSQISDQLVTATYTYVPDGACIESWGQKPNETIYYRDDIIEHSFCSTPHSRRSSVCSGDAGAPFLLISEGSTLQVAVIASPIDCSSPVLALLSVRVSSMYPWIQHVLCQNSKSIPENFVCDGLTSEPPSQNIGVIDYPKQRETSAAFGPLMFSTFVPTMCSMLFYRFITG